MAAFLLDPSPKGLASAVQDKPICPLAADVATVGTGGPPMWVVFRVTVSVHPVSYRITAWIFSGPPKLVAR